jgi:hypothetical protein
VWQQAQLKSKTRSPAKKGMLGKIQIVRENKNDQ